MLQRVVPLSPDLPERLVGRKAAALSRLLAAGFPVPAGVCVTTDAFRAWDESPERDDENLPDGLLDELVYALPHALPGDTPLAVRSSALVEDQPELSLAGRYATYLNVQGAAALEAAVLGCWRSYHAAPVEGCDGCMGVLIQPMLDAECAGVCFTVDPVRLRPDLLLVVSGWGQGAGVGSGSVPTDTIRLRRSDMAAVDASIADKHTALRPSVRGGVEAVPVDEALRAIPCLPAAWLERICMFGLATEQFMGAPQDVEWAIAEGQVWILQSRPVTALPAALREAVRFPITWEMEDDPRHFWWFESAWHGAGLPLLPAQQDCARINLLGGQDGVYFNGGADTRRRRCFNGWVYIARAKNPIPRGQMRVYRAAQLHLQARLARQNMTIWDHYLPEIILATEHLTAFDPREKDNAALAEHIEDAAATAQRHWMIHTTGVGRPIRDAALLESYARLTGRPAEDLAADIPFLLAGSETVQTRLIEALHDLAVLALEDIEGARAAALAYRPGSPLVTPAAASPGLRAFAAGFNGLIETYGGRLCFRSVPGYAFVLPLPWKEAPDHVWEMIAAYLPQAEQGEAGPAQRRAEAKHALAEQIEALCASADPAYAADFRARLDYARRNAAYLDEHNHYIDLLSDGQYLQALLYAGRALAQQGCLESPFDVYWLYTGEVLAVLREPTGSLSALTGERKALYDAQRALIPPVCLGLPDPRLPEREQVTPLEPSPGQVQTEQPGTLRGEPASRGKASGRACLVSGETLPADISPGIVLVTDNAGPTLTTILPAVAALVLDGGSPGEHFAITAREFHLPVVCATLTATRDIPEGAWVTVDGDEGVVRWNFINLY